MIIRHLALLSSLFVALSPAYVFASAPGYISGNNFHYAQNVVINGSNLVKVTFKQVVTGATGALATGAYYVSYIKPNAAMIARAVIPRLVLAATGVGTVVTIGYGAYTLWNMMKEKGYTFNDITKVFEFGGQQVADVNNLDKIDKNFLNDINSYFSGGYTVFAYGQSGSGATVLSDTSALGLCNKWLASINTYNSNFKGSNCSFTGEVINLNGKQFSIPFNYSFIEYGVKEPKSRTLKDSIIANKDADIFPPRNPAKPTPIPIPDIVNTVVNGANPPKPFPEIFPPGTGTGTGTGAGAGATPRPLPIPLPDLMPEIFNPDYPGGLDNANEAAQQARRALTTEVPDAPPKDSSKPKTGNPALPQDPAVTKNPDGTTAQELPDFCKWASSICDLADMFTNKKDPENEKVPELKHEITVSDRLKVVAQCPAPLSFNVMGNSFDIKYDFICSFAEKVRPLVLTAGYVGSAFLVLRRV